jgi:hypothetical protein
MRLQTRRRIVPVAFAVVLTVAAGLALAEEHARASATGPDATGPERAADRNPSTMGGPEQNQQLYERRQAEPRIGVGSRALMGDDGEPFADDRTR